MIPVPRAFPDLDSPPVQLDEAAVYVHFPYCAQKCPYCDFNSHAIPHADTEYADAILRELENRRHQLHAPRGLASIYFGGGTPSRWDPKDVGRVIHAITSIYDLQSGAELTLEVNPESATPERLQQYREAGINRFSIGCQSFNDTRLETLGRGHSAQAGQKAVKAALATGAYVSLDIIYGLPEQSETAALDDIKQGLALEPQHISAYTLTIEPDTVLARRVRLGTFRPMPDDAQAHLIERVSAELAQSGYYRYEISSYAKKGYVARHNTLYWLGGYYLGLGAGAHSYLPHSGLSLETPKPVAFRRENVKAPETYIREALNHHVSARFEEALSTHTFIAERMMVVFRSAYGLHLDKWLAFCGPNLRSDVFVRELKSLAENGFLNRNGPWWRPTAKGFLFNDAVAVAMLEAVDRSFVPNVTPK